MGGFRRVVVVVVMTETVAEREEDHHDAITRTDVLKKMNVVVEMLKMKGDEDGGILLKISKNLGHI